MKKQTVAVLFGGCSSEYGVSLESAGGVIRHLDSARFTPVLVGITRAGNWYRFTGGVEAITADAWQGADCTPAVLSPDRRDHGLLVFHETGVERIRLDAVFPVLHGRNGEDGTVQGLCELAGIPVAGCGTMASALCMDKDRAHKIAALAGVQVPASRLLAGAGEAHKASALAGELGYPLFVKPVKAGSSYGVTRVERAEALAAAVEAAFRYDGQVLLEAAVPGFEVGCAVLGSDELLTGELDEIELADGFFDFTEKYGLLTAKIHVPARISREKAAALKAAARTVYRALGCRGFARVDLFLTPEGEVVFNEVNTIPGFTAHSRFPSMMQAAGLPLTEVLTRILTLAVEA